MKNLFSLKHSLDLAAAIIAIASLLGVLQTFIIGRHFVIPTMLLVPAVLFGNLARCSLRGERWAKHVLFWSFFHWDLPRLFRTFLGGNSPGNPWRCLSFRLWRGVYHRGFPELAIREEKRNPEMNRPLGRAILYCGGSPGIYQPRHPRPASVT